jgi:serine protease Do
MDGKIDASDIRGGGLGPRPPTRWAMFAFAVIVGALVGVAAARVLTAHSASPRQWPSTVAAQLLIPTAAGSVSPSFADLVDKVKPAVIGVQVKLTEGGSDEHSLPQSPRERFSRPFRERRTPDTPAPRPDRVVTAQGSGFFISADGYAVTNNHVVEGNGTIQILTDDQRSYSARVVGTDPTTDLALLKVEGRDDFIHVKLADGIPRVGDWVVAIGNPFGLGGTVTAGIVSARERDIGTDSHERLIQIDAPINKGDSGGPSFDLDGRVIGVNTMIFSPSGGSIGIAFAIPADTVKTVTAQLREKGAVTRGWLGVQAQPITPEIADSLGLNEAHGALVAEPQPDSPAAKAGIKPGDVIAAIDGTPVKDARDLSKTIAGNAPGRSIKLSMLRGGEERTINVTLGRLPTKPPSAVADRETTGRGSPSSSDSAAGSDAPVDLGLRFAPATNMPGSGGQGLVVTGVDPTGIAAEEGLELGDVILEIGGASVSTAEELQRKLNDARRDGKRTVLLRLKSGETTRFVALPIS